MSLISSLRGRMRQQLGSFVHDSGLATRADIRALATDISALETGLARAVEADLAPADIAARVGALERLQRIDSVSGWIRQASLHTHPLVSVIVPTKDRTDMLRRALVSVLAQRYERFEVLVIDDGGQEDSRTVVDDLDDGRIRWKGIAGAGVCAARNAGLDMAAGEIVAYLDDDNLMDSEWLYAVVWAFEQRPDVDVLYGATIYDDMLRVAGESSGALPQTLLPAWNREARLEQDMGAIAHRHPLPEGRFNEALSYYGDADLLRRLTADRDPLMLPVIAGYYTSDAGQRISVGGSTQADREHDVIVNNAPVGE